MGPKAVNAASDLIGLIGAILLAIPFVRGQPAKDALEVVREGLSTAAGSGDVREALKKTAETLGRHVREWAPSEYAYGKWGAWLVALSFFLKLIAVVLEASE